MEFDIWFESLEALCVTRGLLSGGDRECWREEFEKGMTPQEAFDGDWDLY